ncbi:hypothetical protein BCV70DRAFT_55101 [Testicularia cyperi]|uniref:Signal recognition particle receptor subunit beta n=1 Tax=Testicularia cyperi TaxID=1882483 RepID=A0A317XW14_9BASI|nr:hypothetical protein BCV70DRAFT_55101 [Testicularia cyperi]
MAFVAPVVRWPDALTSHLPEPLRESGIPPQYFIAVPATLLAVLVAYTITKASARSPSAQLVTVSSADGYTSRRSVGRSPTVLLVGLADSGKTTLFSSLVYGTTPASLLASADASTKPITLVDLPGHPRLRPLLDENVHQADAIVICVDTVMASKSSLSSGSGRQDGESVTDAADLLHSTLITLAKSRSKGSAGSSAVAPPSILVLFTRADQSPLLGGSSAGADKDKDEKRRAQLLSRCRTTLESELGQRRSNMGLGKRRGGVKIAGLGKVADGDPSSAVSSSGVLGWLKRMVGLSNGGSSNAAAAAEEDEEEEDDEVVDYIDWHAAQRAMEASDAGATNGASSFSLDKLDDEVVYNGKVDFALASLGKERTWSGDAAEQHAPATAADGTRDLQAWLVDLQN